VLVPWSEDRTPGAPGWTAIIPRREDFTFNFVSHELRPPVAAPLIWASADFCSVLCPSYDPGRSIGFFLGTRNCGVEATCLSRPWFKGNLELSPLQGLRTPAGEPGPSTINGIIEPRVARLPIGRRGPQNDIKIVWRPKPELEVDGQRRTNSPPRMAIAKHLSENADHYKPRTGTPGPLSPRNPTISRPGSS